MLSKTNDSHSEWKFYSIINSNNIKIHKFYTYIITNTHTHTHTVMQTRTHTHMHTHAHIHARAHTHTCAHVHMHACTHAHTICANRQNSVKFKKAKKWTVKGMITVMYARLRLIRWIKLIVLLDGSN